MIEFPSDNEIIEFCRNQSVGKEPVVLRDLARIATIFHLRDEGFLNGETVLAGGMALRCYGGNRFTVKDVDTSSKPKIKVAELDRHLNWRIDGTLEVSTEGVAEYKRGVQLETAKPIKFNPLFSDIELGRGADEFELTVSMRGLELDAVEQGFRHGFPWKLGVEGELLPVMDVREMLAEKVVGYCVGVLPKHYADVAFIAFNFRDQLSRERRTLRKLVEKKLENGRALAKGAWLKCRYSKLPDYASLRDPLENPEQHLKATEFDAATVRFVVTTTGPGQLSLRIAKKAIQQLVVPWLFE